MSRNKSFDQTEVLQKVQEIFSKKGFNGTSVDDLVQATGLSRSSLYDTFGDKEKLFAETLLLYRRDNTQNMIELIEASTDIKKTVADIFDFIYEDSLTEKKLGCMMVNTAIELAPHQKKISKLIDDEMLMVQKALTAAIRKGQSQNKVSKKMSAHALATLVLTCINGLRVAEKWGAQEKLYREVKETLLSLF
jgi:TetR/AcrR family transcriptional repressor of nem operon